MSKVRLKANVWAIVTRAVEEGVAFGVQRAYKHRSDELPPDAREALLEHCEREVMNALSEVIRGD